MKKYFSFKLFTEGLKRIRAVGIACYALLFAVSVLPIIARLTQKISMLVIDAEKAKMLTTVAPEDAISGFMLITILAPIVVIRMFSFLNKRSASDFFHSIPQKRCCLFLSFMAAVVAWVLVSVVTCCFVSFIGWNLIPFTSFHVYSAIKCAISYTALGLLSASCMALAVTVTGSIFSALFAGGCILVMPALVINAFGYYIGMFENTFAYDKSIFQYTSTKGFLPIAQPEYFYNPLGFAVISAYLVSVFLLILATVSFVKRKSEVAGHSTVSTFLQHLLRCLSALPICLLITGLLTEMKGFESFAIALIPIAIANYVVYELITTRRLKNVAKTLPVFLVLPVLCVSLVFGAYQASKLVPLSTPKNVDEVAFISLCSDADNMPTSGYDLPLNLLEGKEISDKVIISLITNDMDLGRNDKSDYLDTTLELKLESGKTIWRRFSFNSANTEALVDKLMENEEYKTVLLTLPDVDAETLRHSVSEKVWNCFVNEYNALSNGQKLSVFYTADIDYANYGSTFITLSVSTGTSFEVYTIRKDVLPKTFELYCDINLLDSAY